MSDSSGPHRLEELESKVEKLMGMMSQLLEAKSAGGGRQREEEEVGGTGRGVTHNYSGGAGRASPTADIGYGITAVGAAAAAGVPVHAAEEKRQSQQGQLTISTGDHKVQPAGGQRSTCTAAKLESHISQV